MSFKSANKQFLKQIGEGVRWDTEEEEPTPILVRAFGGDKSQDYMQMAFEEEQDNFDYENDIVGKILFKENTPDLEIELMSQEMIRQDERHEYLMETKSGRKRPLLNSDIVLLNDLYYPLKENLYTASGRYQFLYQKKLRTLHLLKDQCHSCCKTIPDHRS